MIAGEKISIAIKQNHVTAGVPGGRDRQQLVVKFNRFASRKYLLDARQRAPNIIAMHNTRSVEMADPLLMVGYVVAVGKEHQLYAANLLDLFDQRGCEAGRVNQDIAVWPSDQVAGRSVRRFRREAAEVDVVFYQFRIGRDRGFRRAMAERAD